MSTRISSKTPDCARQKRIACARPSVVLTLAFAWLGSDPAWAQQQKANEPDPFAGVEEMIVTGSSAVEILVPPSTAAITFDAKALQDLGVQDVGDIAAYTPNLEVATVNATNASFFIRGVGLQDFGANASSSVPIYQDGIPRNASATQLVGLFDVENVSVLKGPQGSGNLRNASAGAFVITTGTPKPERSGLATVTISKITSVDARDANRYGFETYLNTPIVEDVVMARISARYKSENPFWENRCANRTPLADRPIQNQQQNPSVGLCGDIVPAFSPSTVTPFLHRYIGEVDDYAVRGQLRIQPPDTPIDWTLRVEISNLNRDSTTGQAIGTGAGLGTADSAGYRDLDIINRETFLIGKFLASNPALTQTQAQFLARGRLAKELRKVPLDRGPYAGALDFPGRTLLETHTASTTAVITNDAAVTTVNFGFVDYRKSEQRDTDLTPNEKFASISNDQAWETYGDLSVKGDTIGTLPIGWETGAYGMYEKVEAQTQQDLGRFDNQGTRNMTGFEQEIFSGGVYGQGSYSFLEAFTLSAGLRYNWERKDFDVRNFSITKFFIPFPLPGREVKVVRPEGSRNQRTWDALSGFVNLEYAFTEDIKSYMKYSRGFKAGHFNPSDATAAKDPGEGFADPEQLDSVEWGVQASAWASRLMINGAFFFYNYKNYQVFRLTSNFNGIFRVVQNAKQARNYGAELEIIARPLEDYVPEPIEGLTVTLRGGWLEAEFVEFTVTERRLFGSGQIPVPIDYSGNSLLNAPRLRFSGIFNWPVTTNRFGTLTPQYDFTWTDDVPFDPNNGEGEPDIAGDARFQPYTVGNRAYILHNVRLSWAPPGDSGIEVGGWCRNVTDVRYKEFAVDISNFSSQQLIYVADPRVCGADFRFRW